MNDANDYVALHAVLTHGGFSAAARRLGLPKGTLSKRVARLEASLGVRLLERSTRSVRATEVGREILEQAELVVAGLEAAAAVAAGAHAEPNGVVRLSSPQGLVQGLVSEILPQFLATHPKVRAHVVEMNRPADLVQDRIDLALRARQEVGADATQIARPLGHEAAVLVASPGFLAGLGQLADPEDLGRVPGLAMEDTGTWGLLSRSGDRRQVGVVPRLVSNNVEILRAAAVEGLGVAMLPEHVCRADLTSGTLERVLPEWSSVSGTIYAVFSSRRGLTPAIRALIDFLADAVPRRISPP